MKATIQFLGAAETVTGSKHLLRVGEHKFLIDCGLFQGNPELKERNWREFPVPPHSLDAVLLTHAHIDHIGYLPRLWKQGFRGKAYCTGATSEITRISLPDSGKLQEEFADYANRKGFARHKPALPLYTEKEARAACELLEPVSFDRPLSLAGGVSAKWIRAGHILGSAFIEVTLPDKRTILFGGDLGRPNTPIICDPTIVEGANFLLVESTYGNRVHSKQPPMESLCEIIHEAIANRGVIIIPAFAIGRTQDILYYLKQLEISGKCPMVPVYVDSPMGVDATGVYARHHEDHDLEMEHLEDNNTNPLRPESVNFVKTVDDSKSLNKLDGPAIIIASSGMANGGRVVHHLAMRLGNPQDIVLFVGYQAEGTLGRDLIEQNKTVSVMGRQINVRATIKSVGSLSAHADSDEIMSWLHGFKSAPKQTFIVHGEPEAQAALKERIAKELGWETKIPKMFEEVELS